MNKEVKGGKRFRLEADENRECVRMRGAERISWDLKKKTWVTMNGKEKEEKEQEQRKNQQIQERGEGVKKWLSLSLCRDLPGMLGIICLLLLIELMAHRFASEDKRGFLFSLSL